MEVVDRNVALAWIRCYCGASGRVFEQKEVDLSFKFDRRVVDSIAASKCWSCSPSLVTDDRSQPLWFAIFDLARSEELASRQLRGMQKNLSIQETARSSPVSPQQFAYRVAREAFQDGKVSRSGLRFPEASVFGLGRLPVLRRFQSRSRHEEEERVLAILEKASSRLGDCLEFADLIAPVVRFFDSRYGDLLDRFPITSSNDPVPRFIDQFVVEEIMARKESEAVVPGVGESFVPYTVYSEQFDRVDHARELIETADSDLLHVLNARDNREAVKLARALSRRLGARFERKWVFEQEQGVVDSRRLSSLVTSSANRRVFKQDHFPGQCDLGVSVLIDMSASMRGEKSFVTALVTDLLVFALEQNNIDTEVLGFTTTAGFDNPVRRQWVNHGGPANPGRLNAIQHVIIKEFSHQWRSARKGLGLILRSDFGYENIDGEALHWAAGRLLSHHATRKLMVVVSDGQPFDASTMEVNEANILESHLHSTIARIDSAGISLLSVGACADVTRFYRDSLFVRDFENLPAVFFEALADVLVT